MPSIDRWLDGKEEWVGGEAYCRHPVTGSFLSPRRRRQGRGLHRSEPSGGYAQEPGCTALSRPRASICRDALLPNSLRPRQIRRGCWRASRQLPCRSEACPRFVLRIPRPRVTPVPLPATTFKGCVEHALLGGLDSVGLPSWKRHPLATRYGPGWQYQRAKGSRSPLLRVARCAEVRWGAR